MTLIIDPCYKWNAIYNGRSNRCQCPNSPNIAPATKNNRPKCERNLVKTNKTSLPMCDRSDHDPSIKPSDRNPPRNRGYFSHPPRAFCIEKYNISRSGYHSKFHRMLRLPRKVTLQFHQILRLPRKITLMINRPHTWNAIYNARSNKCYYPNSPNTARRKTTLMINPLHIWNASYNARSNRCHCPNSPNTAPATQNGSSKFPRNLTKTDKTSFTMRGRSEIVPRIIRV